MFLGNLNVSRQQISHIVSSEPVCKIRF